MSDSSPLCIAHYFIYFNKMRNNLILSELTLILFHDKQLTKTSTFTEKYKNITIL